MLRFTSIGIAIRASAERADRASLLGVPVKRLQTVVWALAALLSFIGVFLQAGIHGLPVVTTLNLSVLLAALAALMLGNLVDLPAVAAVGHRPRPARSRASPGTTRRNPETGRARSSPWSSWCACWCARSGRPGPTRTRRRAGRRPTRCARCPTSCGRCPRCGPCAGAARPCWSSARRSSLPLWLGVGDQLKATAAVIFVIIAMSVVVLTGWAGQVSLGQMSFAAFGAAVGAYATQHWHLDLGLSLLLAGLVGRGGGAASSGCPPCACAGFFLAVTTLAFAHGHRRPTSSTSQHFSWVPDPNTVIARPKLFGALNLDLAAHLLLRVPGRPGPGRRGRAGHPPQPHRPGAAGAARERTRARRPSASTSLRAKLTAFAISGLPGRRGRAACWCTCSAGFSPDTYAADQSFVVFIAAVVGGLGSLLGAALGVAVPEGRAVVPARRRVADAGLGRRRAARADDHPRRASATCLPGARRGAALGGRTPGHHRAQPGGRHAPSNRDGHAGARRRSRSRRPDRGRGACRRRIDADRRRSRHRADREDRTDPAKPVSSTGAQP